MPSGLTKLTWGSLPFGARCQEVLLVLEMGPIGHTGVYRAKYANG